MAFDIFIMTIIEFVFYMHASEPKNGVWRGMVGEEESTVTSNVYKLNESQT